MSFKIDILRGKYNNTKTKDGVNYKVDTSKSSTYYEVSLFKRYYDIESREDLEQQIVKDLKEVVKALDKTRKNKEMDSWDSISK